MGCGKYGVRKVWGVESSGAGLLALNPQPIVPKIGISEVWGWKCNNSRQSCFLQWDQCSPNNSASRYSNQNIVLFGCMSSRELCQGSAPSIFFFFKISILCDKEKEIVGTSPAAKGQHMNIRTSLNIYTRGFICSQIFCRFYNT